MDGLFQAFIFKYDLREGFFRYRTRYCIKMLEPDDDVESKGVYTPSLDGLINEATRPELLFPLYPETSTTTRLRNEVLSLRHCSISYDEQTARPLSDKEWDRVLSHLPTIYLESLH